MPDYLSFFRIKDKKKTEKDKRERERERERERRRGRKKYFVPAAAEEREYASG